MNFNEISQPSDRALYETIDASNNSNFLTEDLVQVVRASQNGKWDTFNSVTEVMESLYSKCQQ